MHLPDLRHLLDVLQTRLRPLLRLLAEGIGTLRARIGRYDPAGRLRRIAAPPRPRLAAGAASATPNAAPSPTARAAAAHHAPRRVPFVELLTHLGIMVIVVLLLVIGFFFLYLPAATHHDHTVAVPPVTGRTLADIEELLDARDLRYEVQDSDYVSKKPPLTVVEQYPNAGAEVKRDRKIFVTVVARNPPTVEMPDLKDYSLRAAQETLRNFGLALGRVAYRPDTLHPNAVLAQQVGGRRIDPGTRIARNTPVDLVMGGYHADRPFPVPNLVGRTVGEAEAVLAGLGLLRGTVTPDSLGGNATVSRQAPAFGRGATVRKGDRVDLWLLPPRPRPVRPPVVDTAAAPADTAR